MLEELLFNGTVGTVLLDCLLVLIVAVWANLEDPNSRTNDLDEILGIDYEQALTAARKDLADRLRK